MSEHQPGLTADPLFVGATRPPMRWGVTYSALLVNGVFTMEVFLLTKNLLTLLLALPDPRRLCAAVRAGCPLLRSAAALGADPTPGAARECPVLEVEQLLAPGTRSAGRARAAPDLAWTSVPCSHRGARAHERGTQSARRCGGRSPRPSAFPTPRTSRRTS